MAKHPLMRAAFGLVVLAIAAPAPALAETQSLSKAAPKGARLVKAATMPSVGKLVVLPGTAETAASAQPQAVPATAPGEAVDTAQEFALPLTAMAPMARPVEPVILPAKPEAVVERAVEPAAEAAEPLQPAGEAPVRAVNATPLDTLIARYADVYDVPETLVRRVVKRESNFRPGARNGPYWGLMQIRHDTAKGMGYRGSASGLLDAETNLKYAVKYLRGAYITAGGNHDQAVRFYARGYYYDAKRKGLLEEAGLRSGRGKRGKDVVDVAEKKSLLPGILTRSTGRTSAIAADTQPGASNATPALGFMQGR